MLASEETPTETLLEGRYHLGDCIGAGGMGLVYRAEDVTLGRTVAVKLMRDSIEGSLATQRARREVEVLASLSHPSLVTLLDARVVGPAPHYLVLEFVEGPTLAQRLGEGPLPAAEVAELAMELADALETVHEAGVVHRDVKPSNVLLSPSKLPSTRFRAKLADFGIAFLMNRDPATSPTLVVGTAAYLAPETWHSAPTPAADVYSLGLVLLEALTGSRSSERVSAQGPAGPAQPPPLPAGLPPEWTALLGRMIALDPAARPSAAEVAQSAAAIARSLVLTARTTEPHRVPARPRRPRRRTLGVLAALGALAVAAVPAGFWLAGSAGTPSPAPQAALPLLSAPVSPAAAVPLAGAVGAALSDKPTPARPLVASAPAGSAAEATAGQASALAGIGQAASSGSGPGSMAGVSAGAVSAVSPGSPGASAGAHAASGSAAAQPVSAAGGAPTTAGAGGCAAPSAQAAPAASAACAQQAGGLAAGADSSPGGAGVAVGASQAASQAGQNAPAAAKQAKGG